MGYKITLDFFSFTPEFKITFAHLCITFCALLIFVRHFPTTCWNLLVGWHLVHTEKSNSCSCSHPCVLRAEHFRAGGQCSLPFTSPSSESYKLPGRQFSTDSRVGPLERWDSTMGRAHGGRQPQERELIQVEEEKSHLLRGHIGGAALWERKAGWTPRREVTDSPRPSVARAPIRGLRVSRERRTRGRGWEKIHPCP